MNNISRNMTFKNVSLALRGERHLYNFTRLKLNIFDEVKRFNEGERVLVIYLVNQLWDLNRKAISWPSYSNFYFY